MRMPKEITTVTPTSRIVALIVMTLLPFIAFLFGMKVQNNIDQNFLSMQIVPVNNCSPSPAVVVTATPIPTVAVEITQKPISVTPKKDTTPPVISGVSGVDENATISVNHICLRVLPYDKENSPTMIRTQLNTGDWTAWTSEFITCYNDLSNGSYTFTVQAKDKAGNLSNIQTRHFTVQAQ
jgi:hypothetical protein